jgi:uncharacterized protein (DUF433 family)
MAVAPETNIGTLISSREGVNGGRPCVAGTGISVQNIAILHNQGATPEDIARRKSLTLAQVHAALAYYYANKVQIDASLAADVAEYDKAEKEWRQTRFEGRE